MLGANKLVLKVLIVTDAVDVENLSQSEDVAADPDEVSVSETKPEAAVRPGLVGIHEFPIPDGAEVQWIENGGVNLRCARWAATTTPGKGTVCIVQGRTEFIEKYFEVIEDLRGRGFAVLAFDFRGQGGSDRLLRQPQRGHVDHFSDYVSDLEKVTREVLLPECPAPFFALAHSTGGAVVLHLLQSGSFVFDRAVLVSPLIGLGRKRPSEKTVSTIMRTLNGLGLGERPVPFFNKKALRVFKNNVVTSDERRFSHSTRIFEKAPFLKIGAPTIGWLNAACKAMSELRDSEFGKNNRTPVLIVASGDDKVVSLTEIENISDNMRSIWHVVVPGARHELLMERDRFRDQFWAAFDSFIPGSSSNY